MTQVALPLHSTDGSPFDAIKHVDPDGSEWWSARELMPLLEYARWDAFLAIIEKARASLALVEGDEAAASNFLHIKKVSGARGPAGNDYRLTRFGAYLTAMAGDDTKDAVARARIYFAVKTREAEVAPVRSSAAEIDLNDLHAIARLGQAAERAARRAIEAEARADKAEARVDELMPIAAKYEAIEGGEGLSMRAFHKKYLSAIAESVFTDHLYAKGYLINQLGKGSWSEARQCYRDGSQHRHPGAKGKPYLYLHSTVDRHGARRENPRVLPGDPELAFRDRLAKDGLPVNAGTAVTIPTQPLPSERS